MNKYRRLIASKGEATLYLCGGSVWLYPNTLATTAHYVCAWPEMKDRLHHLKADGWEIKKTNK